MNKALLIIDMLNDFVLAGAPLEVPRNREIIPALKKRLEMARREGVSVIYVCDAHASDDPEFSRMGWPPHAIKGTKGAQIVDELVPKESEEIVFKNTYSSFYKTELEALLDNLKVDELMVAGCVSNICVMSAVADAALRGYAVRVPVDSVASINDEEGEFAFRQMESIYGAIVER